MPPLIDIDTLSNKIRKKGVPPSDFDVKFICNKVRSEMVGQEYYTFILIWFRDPKGKLLRPTSFCWPLAVMSSKLSFTGV